MGRTYADIVRHHTFQVAAALSYYFVLAIFPALIFLSAIMAAIPLPQLFGHVMGLMARLLPPDTIAMVVSVLTTVAKTTKTTALISASGLGIIWVISAAFDALIEAMDIAYDVDDRRPMWKTRLLAIGLGAVTGGLVTVALTFMILGPRFGEWLAARLDLLSQFVMVWPAVHWVVAVGFTVAAVELIYMLAPCVKQKLWATLPGALIAVMAWLGMSALLGIYFRHIANYNRLYGTLGGFIAFMTWLYWNSFVLMVGAELNSELSRERRRMLVESRAASDGTGLNEAA